jgi:hypothetical protein
MLFLDLMLVLMNAKGYRLPTISRFFYTLFSCSRANRRDCLYNEYLSSVSSRGPVASHGGGNKDLPVLAVVDYDSSNRHRQAEYPYVRSFEWC